MESSSTASTSSSAFHATEGPGKGGPRTSSERHSGDHPRKQSTNGPDAPSGSSSSRGNSSNSSHNKDPSSSSHRSSHGSRSSYQQSSSLPQQSSSSSSRGASGGTSSNSNSLPRRNSSTPSGGSSRDRDHRSRGHSKPRDGSSHHRDKGSSSSQHQFGASGNPVVRLRERNNILQMHRTGSRRTNLSQVDAAVRVLGMDTAFMKVRESSAPLLSSCLVRETDMLSPIFTTPAGPRKSPHL